MRSKVQLVLIRFIYIALDVLIIMGAFYVGCLVRAHTLPFHKTLPSILFSPDQPFRFVFMFWILAILFFNYVHNLYQTRRELLETLEVWGVIKSVSLASILTVVVAYLFKIQDFPRSIFVISFLLIIFLLSLWRMLKKLLVERLVASGYNNFNAVIIGAGKIGLSLGEEIARRKGLGIRVVGYLDDFKTSADAPPGTKILGTIAEFPKIATREFVNKIFITVHHDERVFVRLLEEARDLGISVQVIPQGFELMSADFYKYNIGMIPVLEYSNVVYMHRQSGKRIFDLVVGWMILLVALPFLAVIAVLLRMDSPGPVIYKSRRYGRRGKIFYMYKFRSMVVDAERILAQLKERNEVSGPIFKMKQDPRVTRMGAWLRKYSLDELPQLFNVVKGEMSLVGPRPLPIDQVEKEDFRQLKRLDIRPGITGLWQIRGRSDISFRRLLRWDIWYINNWSFWLDLHILLQTIPVVIKARGAY